MSKAKRRILSLCTAVALAVGGLVTDAPPLAMPVYADTAGSYGQPNDGIDFAYLYNKEIYYGVYDHHNGTTKTGVKTPILWRVMGEEADNGRVTLMSEYLLDKMAFFPYTSYQSSGGNVNGWEQSKINAWLNNGNFTGESDTGNDTWGATPQDYSTTGFLNSFEEAELALIEAPASITTKYQNGDNTNHTITPQKVWLPATNNWSNNITGDVSWHADLSNTAVDIGSDAVSNQARYKGGSTADWWLRSPYSEFSNIALSVHSGGYVSDVGVDLALGVRPAFQLNPSSVLFTSKIADSPNLANSETASVSGYYSSTGEAGRENFKLTIVNDQITAPTITGYTSGSSTVTVAPGGSIVLNGTISSDTEKLVYKIVQETGGTRKIVGYGIGAADSITINGTANVRGGGNLTEGGNYTLYVWAQKDNDYNSHEGSEPRYFTLKVLSTNAGLLKVAEQDIDATGDGTTTGNPKTATITVANDKASITIDDVKVAENATAKLYSDENFSQNENQPIALTAGGDTELYIKVTAQDTTTVRYYQVTVTRTGNAPAIAGADAIQLTEGYGAPHTEDYTVSGSPAPTLSVTDPNTAGATVNGNTLTIPLGLSAGNYTATLQAENGVSPPATKEVTVKVAPTPLDPAVSPAGPFTMETGETARFTVFLGQGASAVPSAELTGFDGDVIDVTPTQITTSPQLVTVTGLREGSTTISIGFSGGGAETVTVHVEDPEQPPATHTVTFVSDGETVATVSGIPDGETVGSRWPADPVKAGHTFGGWFDGETEYTAATAITSDVTLYARWTAEVNPTPPYRPSSGSGRNDSGGSSRADVAAPQPRAVTSAEVMAAYRAALPNAVDGVVTAKLSGWFSELDLSIQQALAKQAAQDGVTVKLQISQRQNQETVAQLTLNPAEATGKVRLTASTTNPDAVNREAFFRRWYTNKLFAVATGQTGSYGQPVRIAVKPGLAGMDTENLVFYSYDRAGNSYRRIEQPACRMDRNGWLHFTTQLAGDLIISEGELAKK